MLAKRCPAGLFYEMCRSSAVLGWLMSFKWDKTGGWTQILEEEGKADVCVDGFGWICMHAHAEARRDKRLN